MKKTYIIPEILVAEINCETLIATSPLSVDGNQTSSAEQGGFVKGNTASRNDYDVWNDDWSK